MRTIKTIVTSIGIRVRRWLRAPLSIYARMTAYVAAVAARRQPVAAMARHAHANTPTAGILATARRITGAASAMAQADPARAGVVMLSGGAGVVCLWAVAWPISVPHYDATLDAESQPAASQDDAATMGGAGAGHAGSVGSADSTNATPANGVAPSAIRPVGPVTVMALIERPLFRPDRRPGPIAGVADGEEQRQAEARRAALAPYVLSGTIVSGAYKAAIVGKQGDKEMKVLKVGDALEGWTICDIGPRRVQLAYGEETTEIELPDYAGGPIIAAVKRAD